MGYSFDQYTPRGLDILSPITPDIDPGTTHMTDLKSVYHVLTPSHGLIVLLLKTFSNIVIMYQIEMGAGKNKIPRKNAKGNRFFLGAGCVPVSQRKPHKVNPETSLFNKEQSNNTFDNKAANYLGSFCFNLNIRHQFKFPKFFIS